MIEQETIVDSIKTSLSEIAKTPTAIDTTQITGKVASKVSDFFSQSISDQITILTTDAIRLGIRILLAIAIYYIGRWIARHVIKLAEKIMTRHDVEKSLAGFIHNILNISFTIIIILSAVGVLGINTSSFIALFASAGIAVGMALSGTLQNFAGGVMILLFKPYQVDDFIEAQGFTGTVSEIQIFNTILKTIDNKTIYIPNGVLSTGTINNYSKESIRRVDWTVSIAYGDNFSVAKEVLTKILISDKRIITSDVKHPIFIALSKFNDSSIDITVRAWVKSDDYWEVFFDINAIVYEELPKHNLNFPFPQMDIHINN